MFISQLARSLYLPIIQGRVINSEHWYKLTMLNLSAFGHAMQESGTSSFILSCSSRPIEGSPRMHFIPLSSLQQKAGATRKVMMLTGTLPDYYNTGQAFYLTNNSYTIQIRILSRRKVAKCKVCCDHGITPSDSHRGGSNKSPYTKTI